MREMQDNLERPEPLPHPQPEAPPVISAPRTRFSAGPVNAVIFLLMLALSVYSVVLRRQAQDGATPFDYYWLSTGAGAFVGTVFLILIVYGIGWIPFRIMGRNVKVGRAVTALAALFCLAVVAVNTWKAHQNLISAEKMAEAARAAQNLVDTQRQRLREHEPAEVDFDALNNMQQLTEEAVASLSGDGRTANEVLVEFNRHFFEILARYQSADHAIEQAGGLSAISMADEAAIDARIALLDAEIGVADELAQMAANAAESLRTTMTQRGVPDDVRDKALGAALPRMHLDLATPSYRLNLEILQAHRQRLVLLNAGWGHWTIPHPEQPTIRFEDPAQRRAYDDIVAKVASLGAQRQTIVKQLLEARDGG